MNQNEIKDLSAEIANDTNEAWKLLDRIGHKIEALRLTAILSSSRESGAASANIRQRVADFDLFLAHLLSKVQAASASLEVYPAYDEDHTDFGAELKGEAERFVETRAMELDALRSTARQSLALAQMAESYRGLNARGHRAGGAS